MDINEILKKLELKYSQNTYSPSCANQSIGVFKLDDERFHVILGYLQKELVDVKPEDLDKKLSYADLGVLGNWGKEYTNEEKNIDLSVKEVRSVYKNFIDAMVKNIEAASVEEVKLLNGIKLTKEDPNFFETVRKEPISLLNRFYINNKDILKFSPSPDFNKVMHSDKLVKLSSPVLSDNDGVVVGEESNRVANKKKLDDDSREHISILQDTVKKNEFRKNLKSNTMSLRDINIQNSKEINESYIQNYNKKNDISK